MVGVLTGTSFAVGDLLHRIISKCNYENIVVIEIGSFIGESTLAMLPHIKKMNGKIYCIDWFRGNKSLDEENEIISYKYYKKATLPFFQKKIKDVGFQDNVITVVGSSEDASKIFKDNIADFIFIDGDHSYSNTKKDISLWYPKLKKNRIICGHDFDCTFDELNSIEVEKYCEQDNYKNIHYGVIKAVCERFPNVQYTIENTQGIWYTKKED